MHPTTMFFVGDNIRDEFPVFLRGVMRERTVCLGDCIEIDTYIPIVRVSVGTRVRGVVPAANGPVGFEKHRPWGVSNYDDAVPQVRGPPTHGPPTHYRGPFCPKACIPTEAQWLDGSKTTVTPASTPT